MCQVARGKVDGWMVDDGHACVEDAGCMAMCQVAWWMTAMHACWIDGGWVAMSVCNLTTLTTGTPSQQGHPHHRAPLTTRGLGRR